MAVEELIPAKLSTEKLDALKRYLKRRVSELRDSLKPVFEENLIKWRAAYEARPAMEKRQFPWDGASNLVIPIAAIHIDTLLAQIMAALFKTDPLVVAKVLGDFGPESDIFKEAYQEFMQYVGIEPEELDLYRIYHEAYRECIGYGTTTIKCPWENRTRDFLIPGGDGSGSAKDFRVETIYEGPRPEKLPFDGFYIPLMAKTLDDTDIKCHKRIMLQHELEERKFAKIYDKAEIDKVLASPDRTAPTNAQTEKEHTLGGQTSASYGHKEWDIWECFVDYRYEDEAYAPRMVVSYHDKTDTILRTLYDNFKMQWFVGGRLIHRDDMYYGDGLLNVLFQFQEGASNTYNGYRDNQTIANTRAWRVDPDSKLHQGYRVYPSAMLPGLKDEIEALACGDVSNINLDELRLLLDLAERRSGVSPPQQGMGAGAMTGKRGIYSAMGTLSLMQEGNSRKDLNVSDMRDMHTRLMRLVSYQYGRFGTGSRFHEDRLKLFGKKGPVIQKALQMIMDKRMGLPCYSSNASVNKEVEKQNDVMLSQIMARHYQMVAQLLGSMQSVMTPPQVKQYFVEVIIASNLLMKKILRNFGHEEVERLVPDPLKPAPGAAQGGQGGPGQAAGGGAQPNPDMVGGPGQPPIQ